CATKVKQGINTSDKGSTGNLSVHAKKCWGDDAVNAAKESTLDKARAAVKTFGKKSQGKLTAALKTTKGWAKTFATRPPEKEQIRYCWLQKKGRPSHYVPSKETVARDVKKLYRLIKAKLVEELQESEYKLVALALDCWTSPNHRAFMSVTVSWVRKNE
ncbi:hypothetical protein EV360DRAFT_7496, partial [Lentinula raphanica]